MIGDMGIRRSTHAGRRRRGGRHRLLQVHDGATETERHADGDGRIVHAELLFGDVAVAVKDSGVDPSPATLAAPRSSWRSTPTTRRDGRRDAGAGATVL
jgi:hypothetical protein